MSTDPSIVFIVDDDPSMRASLESLIRSVGHEVRSFATTQEFMLGDRPDLPCCLVLDVRLPRQSGLEFQQEMAGKEFELPIVFITGHGDVAMSVAAMKAGGLEFLTKPFRDQDLLDAVHKGIEIDRSRRAEAAMLARLRQRLQSLTPREREIMALVAEGRLNKQIAADLQLSEATVKVHRAHVMQKMEARSLADLVRIADKLAGGTTKA